MTTREDYMLEALDHIEQSLADSHDGRASFRFRYMQGDETLKLEVGRDLEQRQYLEGVPDDQDPVERVPLSVWHRIQARRLIKLAKEVVTCDGPQNSL